MKSRCALRALKFGVLMIALLALTGLAVKLLWNALLPGLLGWHEIAYFQALGLLVLCRLLFGRFGPFGGGGGRFGGAWRRRFIERWEQMTPEQRQAFRQSIHGGCGFSRGEADQPSPSGTPA